MPRVLIEREVVIDHDLLEATIDAELYPIDARGIQVWIDEYGFYSGWVLSDGAYSR